MTTNQFDLSLPLRLERNPVYNSWDLVLEANGREICSCHKRDAEQIVRSVNAFPALLKACKMGLADIERLYTGQEQSALNGNAAFKALKAAIKQAEAPI